MHTDHIQEQMDNLSRAMLAKGLREPKAEVHIEAHAAPLVFMRWGKWKEPDESVEVIRDPDIRQAIEDAFTLIANLPSPEEAKRQQFMSALGRVIDLGRENGIEVDFVNPLVETMKRLSENALTYQPASDRAGSAPTNASDFDDGNITP